MVLISRKLRIFMGTSIVLLVGFYSTLFYMESMIFPEDEVGVITQAKTRLKNRIHNHDKEIYLNTDVESKMMVNMDVIRKLINDEDDKYQAERDTQLELEEHRLTGIPHSRIPIQDFDKTPLYEGNSQFQEFIKTYFNFLTDIELLFPHPERITKNEGKTVIWETRFLEIEYDTISESSLLQDYMSFEDVFVKDLTLKHDLVTKRLPASENIKTAFAVDGSKGYVMIGGGYFTWYSYLSILALRKTGSTLPIELMLPKDDDYESWLCDDVLPNQLNGKCVLFSKVFGNESITDNIKNYQIKTLALLGSSFEHIFYLDSDNFAVKNPDYLFDSKLYSDYKLITWPDFWRRTTSPRLYDVANIRVSGAPVRYMNDFFTDPDWWVRKSQLIEPEDQLNFHDRLGTLPEWTTESGQMMINKREHFKTLLLAFYYNLYGPEFFYPLLSQGGAGEGDKETIVFASHVLKKPYYQVFKKPDKLYGTYLRDYNWYIDSTIVQNDPVVDYNNVKKMVQANLDNMKQLGKSYVYSYDYTYGTMATFDYFKQEPMFYHIHNPKVEPFKYIKKGLFMDGAGDNPSHLRNYGDLFPVIGFDLELWIWETIKDQFCNKGMFKFRCFEKEDVRMICENEYLENRLQWLRENGEQRFNSFVDRPHDKVVELTPEQEKELDGFIFDQINKSLKYSHKDDPVVARD